ncbi:hypothetical protein NL676_019490 [Syzygium grande]|nr:hypothetical protein NL676_019490 [Syzygium grande]
MSRRHGNEMAGGAVAGVEAAQVTGSSIGCDSGATWEQWRQQDQLGCKGGSPGLTLLVLLSFSLSRVSLLCSEKL